MKETKAKTINFRLKEDEYQKVEDYVKRNPSINSGISSFARDTVLKEINRGSVANVSGKNIFEYNGEKDNFVWKVKVDSGEEKILAENLSLGFLENLKKEIDVKLKERDELIGRKKGVSVPREVFE